MGAKSIVSVKSPLSGTVAEVNATVQGEPERVHRDPYGSGWLARLLPAQWEAERGLLLAGDAVLPAMAEQARLFRAD